ncbi:MAG: ComF family protein [Prevotella sp.]|nr:ComF family protein [Prevotella sp.]
MKTSLLTRLFDTISPRTCSVCGQRLAINEQVICASCLLHLPLTHYERHALDNEMARLFWGQFLVERVAALFFYEPKSMVTQMIYDMKYRSMPEIGETMGVIVARQFMPEQFFEGIEAIVPMPITRRRQWQRGYNQSMEIARGISRVTALPIYNNVVRRVSFQRSQTTQQGEERLHNVEDAFRLEHSERVEGKHLLIVDDIVTTGATVIACGRELAKARDVRISVLSLGFTKSG